MQKPQDGSYDIVANADGTSTVTYSLAVELAIGMLGMFKPQGREDDHGYRAQGAQAAGRVGGPVSRRRAPAGGTQ